MNNKRQFIRKYLIILSGITLTAFAISVFYTPDKIVNGGVSGIATIYRTYKEIQSHFSKWYKK